jgi:hypothetical protein
MIISQEIRNNITELTCDEIVVNMALDIKFLIADGETVDFDSFEFMSRSMNEYNRRGGFNNLTIGSVAQAIKMIITEGL